MPMSQTWSYTIPHLEILCHDICLDLRFMCKTMSGTLASYLISCKTLFGTEASILNYM
ncbi:hypothetical protein F383_19271 [Gossypium arboreum]|uniref:Uncharacterized protein n=1 Tax=Gossypium arboreum TaxID=29729 RepID=A0A0B0NMR9_GOSAR|nr:hypothetical protein F383_19271 [Gossypium arboreum]